MGPTIVPHNIPDPIPSLFTNIAVDEIQYVFVKKEEKKIHIAVFRMHIFISLWTLARKSVTGRMVVGISCII